ncbi:hypothetical protein, partial [Luedemannella flava]|uniref:hypothetical protein n=1 Tax=Luedemannella flava TaxID=349316 RepID=UPI0031D9DF1C
MLGDDGAHDRQPDADAGPDRVAAYDGITASAFRATDAIQFQRGIPPLATPLRKGVARDLHKI